MEILKEESSKTPVFFVAINESLQKTKALNQIQILNQMFTFSHFKEADLILPLDFSLAIDELRSIFSIPKDSVDLYLKALTIAPLLSNITLGFRLKEERDSMRDYLNKLVLFPNMNIFNVAATIPVLNEKGEVFENNIFHFKENKGKFAFFNKFSNTRQDLIEFDKDYASFSEGYILRGLFEEKLTNKPNAYKYNIKGIDALISFEDNRMKLEIAKEIADQYEGGAVEAFPLHSCLFTNDRMKEGMKELVEQYKEIGTDLKKEYLEDEDFASKFFNFINY